jgi:hypothetical protein
MPDVTMTHVAFTGTMASQQEFDHAIGTQIPCYVNGVPAGLATVTRAVVSADSTSVDVTYEVSIPVGEEDKFHTDLWLYPSQSG